MTLSAEEATRLEGDWLYDDTPSLPSKERVERWMAAADSSGGRDDVRRYVDALFALQRPRPIRFERDPRTGTVSIVDPLRLAMQVSDLDDEEQEEIAGWNTILIPRGEGVYALGMARDGELAEFDPTWAPLIEFERDADGRAVRFARRSGDDETGGTGFRPSAGGMS